MGMSQSHSILKVHDYAGLMRRWRIVARKEGLALRKYAEASGYGLYVVSSKKLHPDRPHIYISAGIHGDEPASCAGLIRWAEKSAAIFKRANVLLFPCLNPWGLVNNVRYDAHQRDLNRTYHSMKIPCTAAHLRILGEQPFDGALCLHEDYDACGLYLYEIYGDGENWGEPIRDAAGKVLPVDPRKNIDGRKAEKGIVRRRLKSLKMAHQPEALHLFIKHSRRVITFETPSEFDIEHRIHAQHMAIQAFVKLVEKEHRRLHNNPKKS